MPDPYEVRIRGPIGPLIQACLPGFTAVTAAESTVLTGTAPGPDDLHHLLDVLTQNGLPADDVRLTSRDNATGTTTERTTYNADGDS
jgi:hypothetical protein